MTDLYSGFDYSNEEISLLRDHDEGETLHAFVASKGCCGNHCKECGDTAEGLMHNNTWRNVEPLMED